MNKEYDATLKMGSSMLVVGPTYSGKTWFITRLIDYSKYVFDKLPTRVYWCYGRETKMHDYFVNRNYIMMKGLPTSFDFAEEGSIIVLDDLFAEGGKSNQVSNLFTRDSHHEGLFIIMTSQNLFHQAK